MFAPTGRTWGSGNLILQEHVTAPIMISMGASCSWLECHGLTLATWGFLSCKWIKRESRVCLTWLTKNFFHFCPAKAANCPNTTKAEYLRLSFSCGIPGNKRTKPSTLLKGTCIRNTDRSLLQVTVWAVRPSPEHLAGQWGQSGDGLRLSPSRQEG